MSFLEKLKKFGLKTGEDGKVAGLTDSAQSLLSGLTRPQERVEVPQFGQAMAAAADRARQASANLYGMSDEASKTDVKSASKDMDSFADALLKSNYGRRKRR
jgi:hypothetical protein